MTAEDLLIGAYGWSKNSRPGKIVEEATEGRDLVNEVVRTLFQIGARVRPTFFGDQDTVAFASPGWARPAAAESIWRIELPNTTRVQVVAFDQRDVADPEPAVYELGQVFRSAGNTNDPTSGNLEVFFSKRPTDAATLTSAIDSMWPEAYRVLPEVEIAIRLAIKDKRLDDVEALAGERDKHLRMFLAFLEHATVGELREYGQIEAFSAGSLISLSSLLAGPTTVEL